MEAELEDAPVSTRHSRRANVFRWSIRQARGNGKRVFECPFCGNRARNPELNPNTVKLSHKVDFVHPPKRKTGPPMTKCCNGRVTVPIEKLDDYQDLPYGTHAWAMSYSRRNRVECLNKVLKADEGLSRSLVYAFGADAHALAGVMLSVAHNLSIAADYPRDLSADERGTTTLTPNKPLPGTPARFVTLLSWLVDQPDPPPGIGPTT
jgi:hypothetical protein